MGVAGPSDETGKEDSSKQEVTAQEKGRMPLVETDAISQPVGGRVERNNSYTPELSKTVEAEMERLLTHMAEQEVCQELEENRLSELNEFAKGISYGNAHKGVEVKINRMATVDPEMISQYNAMAGAPAGHIPAAAKEYPAAAQGPAAGRQTDGPALWPPVGRPRPVQGRRQGVLQERPAKRRPPDGGWGSCWMSPVP